MIRTEVSKPNGIAARAIAVRDGGGTLSVLVQKAASQLASASTAAQVLDARDLASVVYDAAKKAARLHRAKGAHDELIAKAHRAQADALLIESEAKRRLADEYDAAQDRGDVAKQGNIPEQNVSTLADIGLTAKDVHEARQIRDAEEAQPGIIQDTVEKQIEAGREPTKASVRKAVEAVNKEQGAVEQAASEERPVEPRRGPRFNLAEGMTFERMAREGMAREAEGENAEALSKEFLLGTEYYRKACDVVFLFDRGGYSKADQALVERGMELLGEMRPMEAREAVDPVAVKVWGSGRPTGKRPDREPARQQQFERSFGIVMQTCLTTEEVELPYLTEDQARKAARQISAARAALQRFAERIKEIHE